MEILILYGNTSDLKQSVIKRLEKYKKHKSFSEFVISAELAKSLANFSNEIGRQVGFLLNRNDIIEYVIVGDNRQIVIPPLFRFKLAASKLRGLRLVHTHLYGEPLTDDDLTDLALLRLDAVTVINSDEKGNPKSMQTAVLTPPDNDENILPYEILSDTDPYNQTINFQDLIFALENEMVQKSKALFKIKRKHSAIIIGVYPKGAEYEPYITELKELAESADIQVIDTYVQMREKPHPKFVIGSGKLKDIVIVALRYGVDFLIFDNNLTPAQAKAITDFTEIKVIDRTQLILDIFARRAKSNEGKIRVELAQLQYILPRLTTKDDSLSRLTGGIGGRGPGETRLEIDRRRINDKIAFLKKKLKNIDKNRNIQKSKRSKNKIPIVSIIGYTNAGKSTLLNSMTNSNVYADNLMFATLDTNSKRLRFPQEREVIITDTVGFIRDLPHNLKGAFKSTLEELCDADMLLHVIDSTNPLFRSHMISVNSILDELNIDLDRVLMVFNKIDLLDKNSLAELKEEFPTGVFISALNRETYRELLEAIEYTLFIRGINAKIPVRDYFEKS